MDMVKKFGQIMTLIKVIGSMMCEKARALSIGATETATLDNGRTTKSTAKGTTP